MMEKVTGDRHRVREARRPPGDVVLQRQTQELGTDIRSGSSKETLQKSLAAPDNRTDEPHAASLSANGRVTRRTFGRVHRYFQGASDSPHELLDAHGLLDVGSPATDL